ncbi:MAG: biopolymer transporter ExbD [Thalassobaculum sp.]|uniref:ExbD/TolR family protein n=1 Tax=Thalassobaculum sp. TaxID=2022740 RepID=UPI0032EC89AA
MRLERPRTGGSGNEDDRILPLINVVFLLLIFFMVVGSLSATDPFAIEPPRSANGEAGDPKDIVLLIGADGRLALDGAAVESAGLPAAIARRLEDAPHPEVHVKADGGAEAAAVVAVMETLREAGVERVRLMTVPEG